MGTTVTTTDLDFKKDVLGSEVPVLVDFWAEWCGPCRMVAPVLETLARDYAGRLKVVKVNADENTQCATEYHVRSVPTFLLFREGRLVGQRVGAASRSQFVEMIENGLA